MQKLKKSGVIMLAILAAGIIGTVVTAALGFDITIPPYKFEMELDTPATAVMGGDYVYVLDHYSTRISCIKDGKTLWRLSGGDGREGEFYKAQNMTADSSGTLYVQNIRYDSQGMYVLNEEVRKYTPDGIFRGVIYSYDYEAGKGPTNNGDISDIRCYSDMVYISRKCEEGLYVAVVNASGNVTETIRSSGVVGTAAIDTAITEDGMIYYTAKDGSIRALDSEGDRLLYMPDDFNNNHIGTIPYNLDIADSGKAIVFTDIGRRRIMKLNLQAGASSDNNQPAVIVANAGDDDNGINSTPLRYPINVYDGNIVTTDSVSIEIFDGQGNETEIFSAALLPAVDIILGLAGWISVLMLACGGIYAVIAALHHILHGTNASMARLSILGTTLVLLSAVLVGAMSISNANDNTDEEFRKSVSYITHLLTKQLDGDLLESIKKPSDINSEQYASLKQTLSDYLIASKDSEYGMYYIVYKKIGNVVVAVLDSDNMYPAIYPMYVSDHFDYVYVEGNYDTMDFMEDAYGIWAGAAGPISNSKGEYVGLLEIGINMYALRATHNAQTFELVLSVAALVVLILFLLGEGVIFINYKDRRREAISKGITSDFEGSESILRTLMFLFFTANAMQDSYISVLAIKIYKPLFGLPASVGGALPITFEMLMISVFSVVGGHLIGRMSVRRMTAVSLAISAAGYTISAISPDFYTLIIGKIIMGTGAGLVYTALNTAVTRIPGERGEGAFSMLNAGMLTGCQCGTVIGAYLYSWFSYHCAYACSAVIAIVALAACLHYVGRDQFVETAEQKSEESSISLFRFLGDRRTWSFLLSSVIPSLLAVAFFEYYFPIFGDSNGLTETRIGQILLINGLCAIYTGPAVTRLLLKKLGARLSVMTAGIVFAAALMLFTISPSTLTMLLIAVAFGMITGFSYSVQSEYFSDTEAVGRYGEGKSMGLYSMFQSISQALAPILIGYMSLSGMMSGTRITAAVVAAASIGFLILSVSRKKTAGKG